MNTNKKVIIITGASKGLGNELAKLYFQKGSYNLILTARSKEGFNEFKNKEGVDLIVGDIREKDTLDSIEKVVEEKYKKVDILINNAGVIYTQPFEKNTEKQLDELFDINLKAPILLTQRMYPFMVSQKSGLIININSTAGKEGKANHTLYAATKFGLRGFTEALRQEAKAHNIRVLSIHPGGMDTHLFDDLEKKPDVSTFMNAKKVAEIIVFLSETEGVSPDEILINRPSS
ncbi:MAG: SDR family oxidoreductase [bacterium]|nr:SDR family oxidoreductase [bacterium]